MNARKRSPMLADCLASIQPATLPVVWTESMTARSVEVRDDEVEGGGAAGKLGVDVFEHRGDSTPRPTFMDGWVCRET